jgi:4-hydroxy-3-polyprenylbenzoate decarboxylase
MTGASAAIYGVRLLAHLVAQACEVALVVSRHGRLVLNAEVGVSHEGPELWSFIAREYGVVVGPEAIQTYRNEDITAPIASGSRTTEAMVVIPCSMGTLARLASGASTCLIERAFDVILKERQKAIVVPRETPVSVIHLENMLRLARAGACILPPDPAFYQGPETLADQVDFIVGKVSEQLGVAHDLYPRYRAPAELREAMEE